MGGAECSKALWAVVLTRIVCDRRAGQRPRRRRDGRPSGGAPLQLPDGDPEKPRDHHPGQQPVHGHGERGPPGEQVCVPVRGGPPPGSTGSAQEDGAVCVAGQARWLGANTAAGAAPLRSRFPKGFSTLL